LAVGLLAACATPTLKDNEQAAHDLVRQQNSTDFVWRRDIDADAAARERAGQMLADGLTLDEAIATSFLLSPAPQQALEQLEVARADLVVVSMPPNPVAVLGMRSPSGNFAAYYGGSNVSFGLLQNVMALMTMPDRVAVARHDLLRAQLEAASQINSHAVQVAQAWIEYRAALKVQQLRERSTAAARAALDTLIVQAANGNGLRPVDIAFERNSVFSAQASLTRSILDAAAAREKLALLLGVGGWRDDWLLAGDLPAVPLGDPDPALLVAGAMKARFDVLAAERAVDSRLRALAFQRRFRWLNQLELGAFREQIIGGTSFTGPQMVIEVPLFDQRQGQLLNSDSELRSALRNVEVARLVARSEIHIHTAEVAAARTLLAQYDREIFPNQRQIMASLGTVADPAEAERLRLRMSTLAIEEEYVALQRDYWSARSALAAAAADWAGLRGF
jgi:outer membrane protein, heavy metal efflux system